MVAGKGRAVVEAPIHFAAGPEDPRPRALAGTRAIDFYAPGFKRYATPWFAQTNPYRFQAVSLTGMRCALMCDHCEARSLRGMLPFPRKGDLGAARALGAELKARGMAGALISGGCDADGRVPIHRFEAELAAFREAGDLVLFAHAGLVTDEDAAVFRRLGIRGVLIDLIGDDATVRQVYHLPGKTARDFRRSLHRCAESGLAIIPHIVLGLHFWEFVGEDAALEMAASYPLHSLVLVVNNPLPGTPMAELLQAQGRAPPVERIAGFFRSARSALPGTKIILGCAAPGGPYKVAIDRAAIDAGLDGIAFPAPETHAYALERGLRPIYREHCCSLGSLIIQPAGEGVR